MKVAAFACLAAALLALAAPAAAHCNYVIDESETLSQIAENYELSLENVTALNPQIEDPNLIFEGDVIRLPCETLDKEGSIEELLGHREDTFYVFTAIHKAGLAEDLQKSSHKWTVFAPTDKAFEAFLKKSGLNVSTLLSQTDLVADVLRYHVSPDGALKAEDLTDGQELSTLLEDQTLTVDLSGAPAVKTTSGQTVAISTTDLKGGKAIIHLVDEVLIPGDKPAEAPAAAPKPATDKPAVKPVPEADIPCEYTVVADDTLFDLAAKYSTTVEDLVKLNPTLEENPDLIVVGSIIKIKECKGKPVEVRRTKWGKLRL